jgi:hypothetical protein
MSAKAAKQAHFLGWLQGIVDRGGILNIPASLNLSNPSVWDSNFKLVTESDCAIRDLQWE